MNGNQLDLAMIIPALNESGIIMQNVEELKRWMAAELPQITYEIVIVNDGSTDGMGAMLEQASANDPHLRVVHHITNMGRGRAVRTGMAATTSHFLIALDADLSYSPDHIKPMLEPLVSGQADMTLASPYHRDGVVENVPAFRAWLSKWGNKVLSGAFTSPVKTVTCVVRAYTRELIEHMELINNGKDFHLEVLYKAELLGFRVAEIPARLVWRDKDRGKVDKSVGNFITRNPLFKMRKAIFSHLVFNFFSRPQLLFIGPIILLLAICVFGSLSIMISWLHLMADGQAVMTAARQALLGGQLTFSIVVGSTILLFALTFFMFLASQSKKYFEEQYIQNARINYRLKQIQKQQ